MLKSRLRALARTLVMPVWRRLWFRIDQRLALQSAVINQQDGERARQLGEMHNLQHDLEYRFRSLDTQWQTYLPSFVGAIAAAKRSTVRSEETAAAIADVARRLDAIEAELRALRDARDQRAA